MSKGFKTTLRALLGVLACVLTFDFALAAYSPGGVAGFTLSGTGPVTFIATGTTNLTLPQVTDTVAVLGTNQTFTANETISGTLSPTGNVATQGQVFKTTEGGNPLMQLTVQNITAASVNTGGGYAFVSGVTGRTIYPAGIILTALGGNAGGSFGVRVVCTGGNVLISVPIANLLSGAPVTFSSTAATTGTGFTGCASGDSVLISTQTSNLTTATSIVVNMPYTIQ